MNQVFLSAVFLQKALTHSPQEPFLRPQIGVEKSLGDFVDWKNSKNFAEKSAKERNREFFRQLAKPGKSPARVIKKVVKNKEDQDKPLTLIIAPHPDDEILATANLISEKLKSREKVNILYITDGDAKEEGNYIESQGYGQSRRLESIQATRRLGLKKSDLFFLGFPDGYLEKLPKTSAVKSKFTGREKTSRQSYFPNLKFSQENLTSSIRRIIEKTNPTEIYFPSTHENHPDHTYIGELFQKNFQQITAKKFTYTVHNRNCSQEICDSNQEINNKKLNLIKYFQTQRFTPHHIDFLEQFAEQKEVFEEMQ